MGVDGWRGACSTNGWQRAAHVGVVGVAVRAGLVTRTAPPLHLRPASNEGLGGSSRPREGT